MSAPQRVEDHRWEALGFAAQQPGPPIAVPVTKRIAGNALTSFWLLTKIAGSLEGYPSGQRGQTVNLLAYAFGGSNPPPSTSFRRAISVAEVGSNHRSKRKEGSTGSRKRSGTRRRRGPGGAQGRMPGVIHLPPPVSGVRYRLRRWVRTTEANGKKVRPDRGSDPERAEGAAPEGRRAGCPESSTSLRQGSMHEGAA